MARIATRNIFHGTHLVRRFQRISQRDLVVIRRAGKNHRVLTQRIVDRRLVTHIENLLARAEIFFRVAMAVEAELHLQRRVLVGERHQVDWTMTGVAADTFIDMNAVIEINEVRKLVDAGPLKRLSGAPAFADWLKISGVSPDLLVAVDAGLGGRNSGEARIFNRRMAIAAIDAKSGDVVLMAERYRLRLPHSLIRNIRSPLQFP